MKKVKMYFVGKFSEGDSAEQVEAMREYFTFSDLSEAEIIYCASIKQVYVTKAIMNQMDKPLIIYCWDYYKWAHEGKHPGDGNWPLYTELLKKAKLVIVPSNAQKLRLKELLGIEAVVVRSGVKRYETPTSDKGFILDPVRHYPDENRDWAERAAEKLGIPFVHSEHQYSHEDFRELVASCTFMTSCVREASTGGLTLMEGLWLGKPSLVSDSLYMGARDYIGTCGFYFKHDDFDYLVAMVESLWKDRRSISKERVQEHMKDFTFRKMAQNLYKVCEPIAKS